jgi:hypothetical protein
MSAGPITSGAFAALLSAGFKFANNFKKHIDNASMFTVPTDVLHNGQHQISYTESCVELFQR